MQSVRSKGYWLVQWLLIRHDALPADLTDMSTVMMPQSPRGVKTKGLLHTPTLANPEQIAMMPSDEDWLLVEI
jgi:hypothetical protein